MVLARVAEYFSSSSASAQPNTQLLQHDEQSLDMSSSAVRQPPQPTNTKRYSPSGAETIMETAIEDVAEQEQNADAIRPPYAHVSSGVHTSA